MPTENTRTLQRKMKAYHQFKQKIHGHTQVLEETIQRLRELDALDDASLRRWTQSLKAMEASPEESLLRVAVIGSVKSGKSTLINCLLGRDLLKRGAGIITAFITRVRTDGPPGGWADLKPWSQIHEELNSSLRLLPISLEDAGLPHPLDMRVLEDRRVLQSVLERVQTEWQQGSGQLDPNFILLKAYLEGYPRVQDRVGEETRRLTFENASLQRHQDYVGQESQAVYVQDLELHSPLPSLGGGVELADCQGSDSPNPLHLELLQRYLLRSHFILYVINSRTGLREADFKLLDFIKTLRMVPQTSFVLNVDLDAHPHREDLLDLVERVRGELSWVLPNPHLFAFSALYHLLNRLGSECAEREGRRFRLWQEEGGLVALSEAHHTAFHDHLTGRISGQRIRLLLGSRLSRLSMVAANVMDAVLARRTFLDEELSNLKTLSSQLTITQKALKGTLTTLENAISGLQESVRIQLDEKIDSTFDPDQGLLVRETLDMVDRFPVDPHHTRQLGRGSQILPQLYRFYTDFRQSVARYLVERVNLRVIELAKEQESFLHHQLTESSHALWGLFDAALEDYRRDMARFNIELHPQGQVPSTRWSVPDRLCPPTFSAFVDRDALGRGILLVKFGLGRVTRFLAGLKTRIGKQEDVTASPPRHNETILEAVALVKSETKLELLEAFKKYGQSFKSEYLYEMLKESTQGLLGEFQIRAEMTQLDFENILKRSQLEGEGRKALKASLSEVGEVTRAQVEELEHFRCAVQLEWL